MTVAVESTTIGNTAGSTATTLTYSHNHTTGNRLFVTVGIRTAPTTISSVTYNGNTMTQIGIATVGTDIINAVYQLNNPPTGTHNVVVTVGTARRMTSGAVSVSGVDAVRAVGSGTTSGSSAQTLTVNVDAVVGDFAVRSDHWSASASTPSLGSGVLDAILTDQGVGGQNSRGAISYGPVDVVTSGQAATAISYTAEGSGNIIAAVVVSIDPASGTTGTSTTTLARHAGAGSGSTTAPATSGSSATTLARHAGAASGSTGTSGSSAITLARATGAGSGSATSSGVTGSSATTLARVSGAGVGSTGVTGTSATTLARHTAAGSGTSTPAPITGASTTTLQRATAAGGGSAGTSGSAAVTLTRATAAASGSTGTEGSSATTLTRATAAGSGTGTAAGAAALVQTKRVTAVDDADGVLTATLDAAPTAGNILVVAAVARRNTLTNIVPAWTNSTVQTGSTDWALIQQRYTAADDTAAGHRGALFWRVAGASEGSTVTFTSGAANMDITFEVFEFSHSFSTPALSTAQSGYMAESVASSNSVSTGSTGTAESTPVLWVALASIRNGFNITTAVFSPTVNEAGHVRASTWSSEFGWLESAATTAQDWTWTVSDPFTSGRWAMIQGIVEAGTSVSGTSTTTLARLAAAGSGSTGTTGSSATTLQRATATGAGSTGTTGSGTLALARHTGAGSGTQAPPGGTGTGSLALDRHTAAGSGSTTIAPVTGTSATTCTRHTAAGVGSTGLSGSAGVALVRHSIAGSGATTASVTGAGALLLNRHTGSGVGVGPGTATTTKVRSTTGAMERDVRPGERRSILDLRRIVGSKPDITVGVAEPAQANLGDFWFNLTEMKYWNGTEWVTLA